MNSNYSEKEKTGHDHTTIAGITFNDILVIVIISFLSGLLILLPRYTNINPADVLFYEKNAALIAFLGLSLYAVIVKKLFKLEWLLILLGFYIIPAIFINLLPSDKTSQPIILACIHLPLLLWCVYGLIYVDFEIRNPMKRVDFIRHNGDMAILGALLLLAGMILAGFTIGLFSSIDLKIEKFYSEYIAIWGVVAAPAITAFIIHHYPKLTSKIAPIIATLFSPLVLITLTVYLAAVVFTGKDPYTDRDFLIMFNLMLVGVMGIIVFSISEASDERKRRFNEIVLFALSIVTLVTDLVALSAIFYRLGEFGVTPNRVAVLGSNILVLGNLILITIDLFKVNFRHGSIEKVNITTARYLPAYMLWTIVVVFGFPLIF